MKKTRFLAAVLAGAMALSAAPALAETFSVSASAAAALPAPDGIKASASSSGIKVTWNAVEGADAYRVYLYNIYSREYEVYKNVSGTACNITRLAANETYKFKVAALIKNENGSYTEQTVSAACAAKTKLPAPSAVNVSVRSGGADISWGGVHGADAYRVYKYSSKSGKYLKYKDVKAYRIEVAGLTDGKTYRFRIAPLVKSGESYKPQEMTTDIFVSLKKSEPFTIPDLPAFGVTASEALKVMDVTNYTVMSSYDGGSAYVCGSSSLFSMTGGDQTALLVNDRGIYYGAMIMNSTAAGEKEILDAFRSRNGEPEVLDAGITGGSDTYLWESETEVKMASITSGMVVYVEIGLKYSPGGFAEEITQGLSESRKASSDI